jgi:hypothetical protein
MKKPTTATEVFMIEQAKHSAMMNYKMAKALVEGKVDSYTLRYAEDVYYSQKEVYEESRNETK